MPLEDKDHHIRFYNTHNEQVIHHFQKRPGKLLVVNWENGSNWNDLCTFLGLDSIPLHPFPHKNKSLGK
jgi:hypothetical protein